MASSSPFQTPFIRLFNLCLLALQWMVIQPGIDRQDSYAALTADSTTPTLNNNTIMIFPAFPCHEWNIQFRLFAQNNTVVEGKTNKPLDIVCANRFPVDP